MAKLFYITPTNEGQDLNYMETYTGTFQGAKERAKTIALRLKPILTQGMIGCKIEKAKGDCKQIAFFDAENEKWI